MFLVIVQFLPFELISRHKFKSKKSDFSNCLACCRLFLLQKHRTPMGIVPRKQRLWPKGWQLEAGLCVCTAVLCGCWRGHGITANKTNPQAAQDRGKNTRDFCRNTATILLNTLKTKGFRQSLKCPFEGKETVK